MVGMNMAGVPVKCVYSRPGFGSAANVIINELAGFTIIADKVRKSRVPSEVMQRKLLTLGDTTIARSHGSASRVVSARSGDTFLVATLTTTEALRPFTRLATTVVVSGACWAAAFSNPARSASGLPAGGVGSPATAADRPGCSA